MRQQLCTIIHRTKLPIWQYIQRGETALRINKFISETGYCSRREADKLVDSGRVTINGVKAQLGSQAEPGDDVRVDGRKIGEQKRHVYIALNKPVGITSTILRSEGKHEKEYLVTVDKPVTEAFLKGMASGVHILGSMTLPCVVTRVTDRVFRIILTEGRNRQIRRMCEAFGYHVRRLQRQRIMNIHLGGLQVGKWRDLTESEKAALFETLSYEPV
jgi:23S rRNA pseudouridine2604 synthase